MSYAPHLSAATPVLTPIVADHFRNSALPLSLEVTVVDEPRSKDQKLNQAVNTLIPAALEHRQGILVIERGYGRYTVRIDEEVPCGMIHESRQRALED